MKILVISQYFYPENFRINDIVKELVKRGHDISVLTGLPNYPDGVIFSGYKDAYKKISFYFDATIYRCKLRPRKKGVINLICNYISFILQAKKVLKKIDPSFDIIFFYGLSPIFSGIPAIWYGKKHHIKKVIYNLDIWPDSVRDSRGGKTMSKMNPIFLFSKVISKHVYNSFDLILNKCDEFEQYLKNELNIKNKRMSTLLEYAENTYLSVNEEPIDNGIIDLMFLGNIGKTQNCDLIVKAFSNIDNEKCILHFVGDGSYLFKLKNIVKEMGLDNKVLFHGKKTIEEVIEYYNMADVCLLTLSNDTSTGLTPPSKLASYMAACRPIIASINGAARKIIEDANCGLVCEADNAEELSILLQKSIDNFEYLLTLGKNGRKYFLNHFTLKKHVDVLESELYSC